MNPQAKQPWLSMSVDYHIDAEATPDELFDDATLWLSTAHGISETLWLVLDNEETLSKASLANALFGVSTLIEMGRRCATESHFRMTTGQWSAHH